MADTNQASHTPNGLEPSPRGAVAVPDLAPAELPSVALPTAELKDFWLLSKPGVTALVVFSAACGLALAPAPPHLVLIFAALLAITLGSAGAAALNMWLEAESDAKMLRTQARPLPAARLSKDTAFGYGALLSVLAFILLSFAAGWQAALLLAFSSFFYVLFYTGWLKRRTDQNIVIGGAAGAFPPVIGWLAGGGDFFHPLPWILFLLIFLWTPPHFWALALPRREEYMRANLPMLPATRGKATTRLHILVYSVLLLPCSLLPALYLDATGRWAYLAFAFVVSAHFLVLAILLARSEDDSPAQAVCATRLFRASIGYLFFVLTALALAHRLPALLLSL